jgi:hypothetical protein
MILAIGLEIRGEFKNSDRPLGGLPGPHRATGGIESIRRGARNPTGGIASVTLSAAAVGPLGQLFGTQKQDSAREVVYGEP